VRPTLLCLLLLSLIVFLPANAQQKQPSYSQPPRPAESAFDTQHFPVLMPEPPKPKLDTLQLQRDARELLELSQSLQPDIGHVTRGLFPKDTLDKLKRIERLSKQLRRELTR